MVHKNDFDFENIENNSPFDIHKRTRRTHSKSSGQTELLESSKVSASKSWVFNSLEPQGN